MTAQSAISLEPDAEASQNARAFYAALERCSAKAAAVHEMEWCPANAAEWSSHRWERALDEYRTALARLDIARRRVLMEHGAERERPETQHRVIDKMLGVWG